MLNAFMRVVCAGLTLVALPAFAQAPVGQASTTGTALAFEVATVKPAIPAAFP